MHLSDEQLRELDSQSNKEPANAAQRHLSQCDECQLRFQNVKAFRRKLAHETETALPVLNWQAITCEIGPKDSGQKLNNNNEIQLLDKKVKRLQIALMAIAASVLIVIAYPQLKNNTYSELELKLAAVIKENHLLQNNFAQAKQTNNIQLVAYRTAQRDLQEIDQQIQLSYLDKLTTKQKIKLWDKRKQLLIKSLNNKPQQTLFVI